MPRWKDLKRFCERDGWELYKNTDHYFYRKIDEALRSFDRYKEIYDLKVDENEIRLQLYLNVSNGCYYTIYYDVIDSEGLAANTLEVPPDNDVRKSIIMTNAADEMPPIVPDEYLARVDGVANSRIIYVGILEIFSCISRIYLLII